MGKSLAETYAVARAVFEEADATLGFSLSKLCFEGPDDALKLTENTQPALLAVSTAAFAVLREMGHEPDYVAGHSLGEYSALVAAGALTFADAVRLVRKRGQYMQEAVPQGVGAMAALLKLPEGKLDEILAEAAQGEVVSAANLNSPDQVVIAGHAGAVERAMELAKNAGARRAVPLPVSAPFHCALMKPAQDRLAVDLNNTPFEDLRWPLINNVGAREVRCGAEARQGLIDQVSESRALERFHPRAGRAGCRALRSKWAPAACSRACYAPSTLRSKASSSAIRPTSGLRSSGMSGQPVKMNSLMRLRFLLPAARCVSSPPATRPLRPMSPPRSTTGPSPIEEVNRIYESQLASSGGGASEDLTQIQKLEVLRSLVDNEIMLQRAEKLGLMATDSDVDAKFNELKAPYTQEEFQKQLDTLEDVRDGPEGAAAARPERAEADQQRDHFADQHHREGDRRVLHRQQGQLQSRRTAIHLAQILVTRRARSERPQPEERQGAERGAGAQENPDARRAPSPGRRFRDAGGELFGRHRTRRQWRRSGFRTHLRFRRLEPGSAKADHGDAARPGFARSSPASRPIASLKMISKEPAGQRDLNDPRVQQTIREGLLSRKDQLLRNAYYETARNEATVMNYLAKKILETKGQ